MRNGSEAEIGCDGVAGGAGGGDADAGGGEHWSESVCGDGGGV